MTDHTVEWYESAKDPVVVRLAASLKQRAQWGQPDIRTEPDALPTEIAELIPLFQQRISYRTQAATQAIASDVEFVTGGAKITQTDGFHVPAAGPSDLDETRASRAHAERLATARRVIAAAERVKTASDIHRLDVDALRKAAIDAMHHLHVTFQRHHRFASRFTFIVPSALDVDDAMYEIGLARVQNALQTETTTTNEEGAA